MGGRRGATDLSGFWILLEVVFGLAMLVVSIWALIRPRKVERLTMPPHLHKRSSCYSCERQLPPEARWAAQPSKCFSCERQLVREHGAEAGFFASRTFH